MADYCGGEYCCPTIWYSTCIHCDKKIKKYPNRSENPDQFEWHHKSGIECADYHGQAQVATPKEND